jgi:hypothetical protein
MGATAPDGRQRAIALRRQMLMRGRQPPPDRTPKGPCNRHTYRCLDARRYDSVLRPCCRGHVRAMMASMVTLFDAAHVTYWADYGTLLGAVRNPLTTWVDYPWLPQPRVDAPIPPGIIPHDKDADIGVMHREWALVWRLLRRLCMHYGYDLKVRPIRGSMKVRLSHLNKTNIDVFFWHERKNGTLFRAGYAAVDTYKGREFHKDALLPLTTVEWEGLTLPAPRDPEAFLAMRYGPNWRTPIMANNDGVAR